MKATIKASLGNFDTMKATIMFSTEEYMRRRFERMINRIGEKGSLCLIPREGLKFPNGEPLRRIEYVGVEIHSRIRLMKLEE